MDNTPQDMRRGEIAELPKGISIDIDPRKKRQELEEILVLKLVEKYPWITRREIRMSLSISHGKVAYIMQRFMRTGYVNYKMAMIKIKGDSMTRQTEVYNISAKGKRLAKRIKIEDGVVFVK